MKSKEFLRSNWLRLISVNYEINPEILKSHIPFETELESHNGKHYVSLVAFRYSDTRLKFVKIPFHSTFEEINLRFYVRRKLPNNTWRSEVAFTKLFFPKKALTFVAKKIYKENYETRKMKHDWTEDQHHLYTSYGLFNERWHNISIKHSKNIISNESQSDDSFFSKHYWGTSKIKSKSASTAYRIEHPQWDFFHVIDYHIDFDFGLLFGNEFESLNHQSPSSISITQGSEVIVNKRTILK